MTRTSTRSFRLLVLSNGHGEDTLAVAILTALFEHEALPPLEVSVWPMVGRGAPYEELGRRIPLDVLGPPNLLPSDGFAVLDWRLFARDLRAGWLSTHARQLRAALRLRGTHDLALAVGDVVVMTVASLARTSFAFVGCAKSAYYSGGHAYTRFEKSLLRRRARISFPRDERTAQEFREAGITHRYVGNPMMDGLEPRVSRAEMFGSGEDASRTPVLALLPGSRSDAVENALTLLRVVEAFVRRTDGTASGASTTGSSRVRALVPVTGSFDIEEVVRRAAEEGWTASHATGRPADEASTHAAEEPTCLSLTGVHGSEVRFWKHAFADVLHAADLVVGMAGTANEQAVGLGKPLVTVPAHGGQGERYVAMKAAFFGEAAETGDRDPVRTAERLIELWRDPARRDVMARAGRERMGRPGASRAIADWLVGEIARGAAVREAVS